MTPRPKLAGHVMLVLVMGWWPGLPVRAQEGERPFVRVRIEPDTAAMVGEPARLVVDVLTPSWFLSPPQFPTLEVEDSLVVFEERGRNLTERAGSTTWSGIKRFYLIYPMRPGPSTRREHEPHSARGTRAHFSIFFWSLSYRSRQGWTNSPTTTGPSAASTAPASAQRRLLRYASPGKQGPRHVGEGRAR